MSPLVMTETIPLLRSGLVWVGVKDLPNMRRRRLWKPTRLLLPRQEAQRPKMDDQLLLLLFLARRQKVSKPRSCTQPRKALYLLCRIPPRCVCRRQLLHLYSRPWKVCRINRARSSSDELKSGSALPTDVDVTSQKVTSAMAALPSMAPTMSMGTGPVGVNSLPYSLVNPRMEDPMIVQKFMRQMCNANGFAQNP